MAGDPDHPIVLIHLHMASKEQAMGVYYAYLKRIGDQAWLARSLEESRSGDVQEMLPIDPGILELLPDAPDGETVYRYRLQMPHQ